MKIDKTRKTQFAKDKKLKQYRKKEINAINEREQKEIVWLCKKIKLTNIKIISTKKAEKLKIGWENWLGETDTLHDILEQIYYIIEMYDVIFATKKFKENLEEILKNPKDEIYVFSKNLFFEGETDFNTMTYVLFDIEEFKEEHLLIKK